MGLFARISCLLHGFAEFQHFGINPRTKKVECSRNRDKQLRKVLSNLFSRRAVERYKSVAFLASSSTSSFDSELYFGAK